MEEMGQLVEYIAKKLVDDPESVSVNVREEAEDEYVVELRCAQDDMGKVIGKQGRIAKAIRTIVRSAAIKSGKRINVEILD